MRIIYIALLLLSASSGGAAQPKIPNLGEKVCALWTAVIDKAKSDTVFSDQARHMDSWALGYLKGMAAQYTFAENDPNPLIKLRSGEELEWMRSYCRINPTKGISEAALSLLEELQGRP